MRGRLEDALCPVESALILVGGKYKAIIVWNLARRGTLRYGELRRIVPKATPKMLAQQLHELEADGLVSRKLYATVPPKTEYSLTEAGRLFVPAVDAMCDCGRAYLERAGLPVPGPRFLSRL